MSEQKFYTGVGSRYTPPDILDIMKSAARFLYFQGYTLRSGGVSGADVAFEIGAGEKKEIYLPFEGFNNHSSKLFNIPDKAYDIAGKYHPVWDICKPHVRSFHARNVLQVYGKDLQTFSDFVICWTRGGKAIGGTGMAIRLANAKEIPIFNLAIEEDKQRIISRIKYSTN